MGKFLGGLFVGVILGLALERTIFPDGATGAIARLGDLIRNNLSATLP